VDAEHALGRRHGGGAGRRAGDSRRLRRFRQEPGPAARQHRALGRDRPARGAGREVERDLRAAAGPDRGPDARPARLPRIEALRQYEARA
jgi:hypothetical protein